MPMTRQTILASRPAAMVLALTLVAGLTAPFVMLPRAHAQTADAPPACNNFTGTPTITGCTEISATPPEDTVAVPPNLVLMLDDSGSMAANFMPDWGYLLNTSNNAVINANNNGVYYNPSVTYTPPPRADGTLYPDQTDMSNVNQDGFGVVTTDKINLFTYNGKYECNDSGSCSGSTHNRIDFNVAVDNSSAPVQSYDEIVEDQGSGRNAIYADEVCSNLYRSHKTASNYSFTGQERDRNRNWTKGRCQFNYRAYVYFQYSTGPAAGPYTVHYVAPASQGCMSQPNCVVDTDTNGKSAPADVAVGNNVANWFAYSHTRILMAKTGLMKAFDNLNPNYRFGFGSINGNNDSDLPNIVSSNGYKIASVYPFGDGMSGSQRAKFWTWIANERAGSSTPLRRALQAVGQYYQTSQPWTSMDSDPGGQSDTTYACRASYAILTTDGFWNGSSPSVGNVDNTGTGPYDVPGGNITGYSAVQPFKDDISNTLADVAMYYWANDLRTSIDNEVPANKSDPASWQHMTTFTVGMGFTPEGIGGTAPNGNSPPTMADIFNWAHDGGDPDSPYAITNFSWPTPSSGSKYNITDLAHAAVNGHGDFFSVRNPDDMAAAFSKAIADINAANVLPSTASVNTSVLVAGAQGFQTGYNTGDWSGQLLSVALKLDGSTGATLWDANTALNASFHSASGFSKRNVYTDAYNLVVDTNGNVTSATFDSGFQLTAANAVSLDAVQTAALQVPALAGGDDTLAHRINYLLGDNSYEGGVYRARTGGNGILGAIIRSAPVYVQGAVSGYYDTWPAVDGDPAPESASDAQKYDAFVAAQQDKEGMVYVGANDGMLHAFYAPVPTCNSYDSDGNCTDYSFADDNKGTEAWAFVPRAVYANLGALISNANFSYRPTVDGTPVSRDVFFSDKNWHTVLAGGVGVGGRGVYALDITDPATFNVLWEFDSDMTPDSDCVAVMGDQTDANGCKGTDLGYTIGQPNIGRLSNGTWVVLVPNGYFPQCNRPDIPTADQASCQAVANEAPMDGTGTGAKPYSALFVLDAETGKMIAELKTPTDVAPSWGLATPVLGDYQNDQVDDVAFAGDAAGNLWRFDLKSTAASGWTVTLVYKATTLAAQPITTMPRLFPDPVTNRFMVLFGTGMMLGVGDNSDKTVQAVYAVRDKAGTTYTRDDLTQQYLHETTAPTTLPNGDPNPNAGASLRCVTGAENDSCDSTDPNHPASDVNDSSGSGGWFINLYTTGESNPDVQNNAGERVVVSPGAIFASNTVVFETLITGSENSDPCSPTTVGAFMALNAVTGAPAGVSSLGGWPIVGSRIDNARTSGGLPVVSALGGGQAYLPGMSIGKNPNAPSIDAPIWRRRSWSEIN